MRFLFDEYTLDPSRRELLRDGQSIHIEPQVFDLLLHLVRNRDRVVSKDDVLDTVWRGRVVSDSTLTSRINAARQAIGDSGEAQRCIRTVARRGWRFTATIREEPTDVSRPTLASFDTRTDVPAGAPLDRQVTFCRAEDGVHLAMATSGSGPSVIKAANWLSHIEYDWISPATAPLLALLNQRFRLIRYDERGMGLSDWSARNVSFDIFVHDLETVADASGVARFALLGISQGAAIAAAYAARHPDRVTKLVLCGGYALGWRKRGQVEETARRGALAMLIRHGWGQDNPAFRQVFSSLYVPDATAEQMQAFNEMQRLSAPPENAARLFEALGDVDVSRELGRIVAPTLVMHSRGDGGIPFEQGLALARGIPKAKFVALESRNHVVLPQEPAWQRFADEVCGFLAAGQASHTL